ncbi:MFS transporter [Subtercola endophyticus]|uniref:MFS transporter n=1 Tax=Subtercola endophyticus TaxID=2895559 RepID=UPI001E31CC34|nr:MFS transporter [Subtercola endophyticus]UFS59406.1 MFS transporter [Subtercola endophyticus]
MTTTVKAPSTPVKPRFPYAGLFILAIAVFISVTAEMMPTGLLPLMSAELGVGEAQIGLLVTFFALSVVITSVPLVALTRRFSRHSLIVVVLLVVSAAALFSALAPSYPWLVGARLLGGVAHGLFWAVVGAYSAHLVPKEYIGRAVAVVTSGGTLALVFGVPLATVAGQNFGWRAPFATLAVLGVCAAFLILRFLPRVNTPELSKRTAGSPADARPAQQRGKRRIDPTIAGVVLICVTTAVIMVGHYSLYTYIAPFLTTWVGVPADHVGAALFANGLGGALGLVLVAVFFGKRPMLGIVIGVVTTAVAVTVMAFVSPTVEIAIGAFVLWGAAGGLLPSLLQARLLHVASARIRDTATAFFSTSFNVGIASGAVLGGALLTNVGLWSLPLAYLVLLGVGLGLLVWSALGAHRRRGAGAVPLADSPALADSDNAVARGEFVGVGFAAEGFTGLDDAPASEASESHVAGAKVTLTDFSGPKRPADESL